MGKLITKNESQIKQRLSAAGYKMKIQNFAPSAGTDERC